MAHQATTLGDEEINSEALASIQGQLTEGERILFQSGFDWKSKVIALTNQAIIVGDKSEGVTGRFPYEESLVERDKRTLTITSNFNDESNQQDEVQYRMGQEETVHAFQEHIFYLRTQRMSEVAHTQAEGKDETADGPQLRPHSSASSTLNGEELSIGDRVKFWEEQDKINQELIPRVIRQSELLTKHIGEHDNLPEVAGNAISQALARAREEERQHYIAALDAAKTELTEQAQTSLAQAVEQLQSDLTIHKTDLKEQTQATIHKALEDMQAALTDAKAELSEQTRTSLAQAVEQLQTALTTHKTDLNEQAQSGLDQALATLREESRKARNLLIGIAAGAGVTALVAIIVAVLT